jgi:Cd2+/Zn2+-exporting ATPase
MATDPEENSPVKKLAFDFSQATPVAQAPLLQVTHVHGPGCGHDHHDHHDHDHPREERPATTRACGGADAIQLDVAFLLPGESDEVGRFEQLERDLRRIPGVLDAHLRKDAQHLELCVHVDRAVGSPEDLLPEIRTASARAGRRYLARTWFVRGMDSVQCGQVIEHVLRRTPGILSADVAYAAERLVVEYDSKVLGEGDIERKIDAMGYALETPSAGHACSHHAHSGGLAPQ